LLTMLKVSRPGKYSGYSDLLYADIALTSQYVPGADGTNLAVDIYRPAAGRRAAAQSWPALIINTQYHRRGQTLAPVLESSGISNLVKHGYAVIIADVRGSGASFGTRIGWTREQALDARALLEWTVSQTWCSGRIGMMGGSQMGQVQLAFARIREPHLISIMPAAAPIDIYDHHYPGGVWEDTAAFSNRLKMLDSKAQAQPVDEDPTPDFPLMTRAIEQHQANIYGEASPDAFRDEWDESTQSRPMLEASPLYCASAIKSAGVDIYVMGGWYDIFLRDSLVGYKLFGHKLIVGPWNHSQTCFGGEGVLAVEYLRWVDCTLKDIDNGILQEPRVYFYTINALAGKEWRFADDWPLPNQKLTNYYFEAGPSGTIHSVNDGSLSPRPPSLSMARDDYVAQNNILVLDGKYARAARRFDDDMTPSVDQKGLTYTTARLDSNIEVTGHPLIHLWVTSSAPDGNFFAFLEDVDESGVSHYVSDRGIRASRRLIHEQSPWTEMGIPFHRAFKEDYAPLPPGQPVELVFDLYAISYIFRKGNRIRVTVTCSHLPTYHLPPSLTFNPVPLVRVFRALEYPSCITLPIVA
jgi:putative CocE/NonD family hydrolase